VDHIRVIKRARDVKDPIHGADVGEESVAQTLPLRGAPAWVCGCVGVGVCVCWGLFSGGWSRSRRGCF